MVIFRVLCGEWIEPLYECMLTTGVWAAAFFMPALIVGNFLVNIETNFVLYIMF